MAYHVTIISKAMDLLFIRLIMKCARITSAKHSASTLNEVTKLPNNKYVEEPHIRPYQSHVSISPTLLFSISLAALLMPFVA